MERRSTESERRAYMRKRQARNAKILEIALVALLVTLLLSVATYLGKWLAT